MNGKRATLFVVAGTLALLGLLLSAAGAWAAPSRAPSAAPSLAEPISHTLSYQGYLTDESDQPVSGSRTLDFSFYTGATGGKPIYTEQSKVAVENGLFTAQLDVDPTLFDGGALWLGIQVEGDSAELAPRQPLLPTPYAFYALSAPWTGLTGVPKGLADTWRLAGNRGATYGTDVLGTLDPISLTLVMSGTPALRLEYSGNPAPNLVAGYTGNGVTPGAYGAVIAGGGREGTPNSVTGSSGTVSGGHGNTAGADGVVGGGAGNTASGLYATVDGGSANAAAGQRSAIGGGANNTTSTSGWYAAIGGGYHNDATSLYTVIGGGYYNSADGQYATTGGGRSNSVSGKYATIGGGYYNEASGADATVSGGYSNAAGGLDAAIGGGADNTASGARATVGGGMSNRAIGLCATVGGGYTNTAQSEFATIGGGSTNMAFDYGTVAGGSDNTTTGSYGAVGGGYYNHAVGYAATVPGGRANAALGSYSFAAGYGAQAGGVGSFVWSSGGVETFTPVDNCFVARAPGGVVFLSDSATDDTATGTILPAGDGSWHSRSDRNAKENFQDIDLNRLLQTLAGMPIQSWNMKSQDPAIRHIGPVAQDFNGDFSYLFGQVDEPLYISNMDETGVALAAAQGLYQRSQEQAAQIAELQAENAALQSENESLQAQLADLAARVAAIESAQGGER